MRVLGLSAFYHESACCLLVDGRLVAAASEERFSRLKHDARLPVGAFRYCLDEAGIGVDQIDALAYYEEPATKLSRQIWSGIPDNSPRDLPWLDPRRAERVLREHLGFEGPLLRFPHHLSHAASAFDYSGFERAAVLTVDGVGEWATTGYGRGGPDGVELFDEVAYPHSLGLFYSTLTAFLGFRVNDGEYKVMGLAPYGEPRFADALRQLIENRPGGQYRLRMEHFDFLRGRTMDSPRLAELLGVPPRRPGEPLHQVHRDIARSLQVVFEEVLLSKVAFLHRETGEERLVMAGGVALNCVANGRIRREGPFQELFVQPAAGDAGGCLGAAALAHRRLTGAAPRLGPMRHAHYGPGWTAEEIAHALEAAGLAAADYRGRVPALLDAVVDRLLAGGTVGWFHGRMELGPRALGARSILGNPLLADMRDRINAAIKKREGFRPFAPSVLASRAGDYFELPGASPFMLETCRVRPGVDLPSITHVDRSARPQTVDPAVSPRYAELLSRFGERSGAPVLLNTSFNVADEPIVCSPEDALACFLRSGLDALVLEDFLLDRDSLPEGLVELAALDERPGGGPFGREGGLRDNLYTFV